MLTWVYLLLSAAYSSPGDAMESDTVCYGRDYTIPQSIQPHLFQTKLFFRPTSPKGSPQKLVLDNYEVKDTHYKSTFTSFQVLETTDEDDGIFSVMNNDGSTYDLLRLDILDCSHRLTQNYGETLELLVEIQNASYLEFLPLNSPFDPVVLWSQNNGSSGVELMGQMEGNSWVIKCVTQKQEGHYTFRYSDRRFLSRNFLGVKENHISYTLAAKEDLTITFNLDPELCYLYFFPEGKTKPILLIRAGKLVDDYVEHFKSGIELHIMSIFNATFYDLHDDDSGMFELRDQDSNLALMVMLTVLKSHTWQTYIGFGIVSIAGAVVAIRSCCKGNLSKRNTSASRTGQAVFDGDETYQLTGQPSSPSYPSQPYFQTDSIQSLSFDSNYPIVSSGSTFPSQPNPPSPQTYTSVEINEMANTLTEGSTSRGLDPPSFSLGYDCLSDTGTWFPPQGQSLHFDLPLSSDPPSYSVVYTSDKLNFL